MCIVLKGKMRLHIEIFIWNVNVNFSSMLISIFLDLIRLVFYCSVLWVVICFLKLNLDLNDLSQLWQGNDNPSKWISACSFAWLLNLHILWHILHIHCLPCISMFSSIFKSNSSMLLKWSELTITVFSILDLSLNVSILSLLFKVFISFISFCPTSNFPSSFSSAISPSSFILSAIIRNLSKSSWYTWTSP